MTDESKETLLALTADIVAAHVGNNNVPVGDLPGLIQKVHNALSGLGSPSEPEPQPLTPAVSVRSSVKPDYIVCLEDGKKLKMLKRHLMTHYQMTPDQYRTKWKLPADYPMVAPNYADQRKALAIKIGLGRKPKVSEPVEVKAPRKPRATAPAEGAIKTPAKRGRKPAAAKTAE
ncbi:MucR family transcriptional regulator [Flavisphingomonas formosensis]|uniref:MucR family transcriptional regulator n=1 Tax=Flavisphingomonas formosensis TaxID=861534 RepID=UPI0012FA2B66|nr:MucR family transcriptional regulator [Sphingomonas formosensis]